ncbi:triple tyrosine motif-containing protein [Cesiribacter sp. SM1]|uniref:ligand-binding sensor domain-containing protein n=1 Tax=Cesiribacter sp. SM1 TaxID=2861196 RepID=UPI001CD5FCED|nr:triple tyrosine motif-containing protein [Cesiribacter sp. SM1]
MKSLRPVNALKVGLPAVDKIWTERFCKYTGSYFLLWVAIFVLLVSTPLAVRAQESTLSSDQYRYYDINKIHSNEVIKGITKDEKGFVWLATDQGVLRFDGNETVLFFKELPSPYTKKFLKRKNGQLLVLTDYGIREIIHNQDTTYFRPLEVKGTPLAESLNYPKSVYEDKEGNIWIGEANAVVKISDAGFKRYFLGAKYQSINYHRSFSFAEDAFGHIWVAPYNGRLLAYNKAEDKLEDAGVEDYPLTEVTSIVSLRGDHLLISGKEGILQLKIDSGKNILENEGIGGPTNISTSILVGNVLYAGTWGNGLYVTNTAEPAYEFRKLNALSFRDVLDFHHDPEHDEIWITGSENIGLLKPTVVKPLQAVGDSRVESFTFDSTGTLYYSTGEQLLKLAPAPGAEVSALRAANSTYFDRIVADGDKLWIGDALGRISYYELNANYLQLVRDSISGPTVTYILKDREDNKWFTGLNELVKVDARGEVAVYEEVTNSVVMGQSAKGQLLCGGQGREGFLYRYEPRVDVFVPLEVKFDFAATDRIIVNDMAFDSLGNAWLATSEGLVRTTEKEGAVTAERISLKGFDINEPLTSIAIVGEQVWLAYPNALAFYQNGQVVLYTRENGLPSRVLKERCFRLHNNKLYVATAKGLAQIDIMHPIYRTTPQPQIKGVLVNGDKVALSASSRFTFPHEARMQFDFVSLTYPGNNVLYQTRLKGAEKNWSEPTPNSSISIFGFSEGTYTLQVRARDMGYLWSEPMEFTFVVAAPWYKSWWALLLFILAGVVLIMAAVKVYHFHLINQKRKLQKIIEERTREINLQKNEIIEQKNKLIRQKEELIEKNDAVYKSQKALSEADLKFMHLKEKQLQDQIEYRNKQITTHTLNIIQKNEMMQELRNQLEKSIKASNGTPQNELRKMLKLIDESYRLDKDWEDFKLYFEQIHTGFYAKLKINYPDLTNQELRHCALIRLNLSNAECASLLGISPASIKVTRTRLRKKLGLENHQSLTDLVMGI